MDLGLSDANPHPRLASKAMMFNVTVRAWEWSKEVYLIRLLSVAFPNMVQGPKSLPRARLTIPAGASISNSEWIWLFANETLSILLICDSHSKRVKAVTNEDIYHIHHQLLSLNRSKNNISLLFIWSYICLIEISKSFSAWMTSKDDQDYIADWSKT